MQTPGIAAVGNMSTAVFERWTALGPRLVRALEPWAIGGFSILAMVVLYAIQTLSVNRVNMITLMAGLGGTMLILAFIVNYTHTLWSFRLAYQQERAFLLRHIPTLFIAPLITLAVIVTAYMTWQTPTTNFNFVQVAENNAAVLGVKLNWTSYPTLGKLILSCLMIFQVLTASFHYAMQAFGVALQTARERKQPFNAKQKQYLLANLYALWALNVSWGCAFLVAFNSTAFSYIPPLLPEPLKTAALAAFIVTLVLFMWTSFSPSSGRKFNGQEVIPIAGIWIWLQPFVQPFGYQAWVVPLAHSVQYLWYVGKVEERGFSTRVAHLVKGKRIAYFSLVSLAVASLGYLAFRGLPMFFADHVIADSIVPPGFFAVCAYIWLSTHHYAVDGVVWKDEMSRAKQLLKLNS